MSGGGLQPHRKGAQTRTPGPQLSAMLRGKSLHGHNPAHQGAAARLERAGAARKARTGRRARPAR